MPRFTGEQARWESFRRWLAERLMALGPAEILVIEAPDGGYVQFINEGPGILGECSDPQFYESLAERADHLDQEIRAAGWGPIDAATGSPNYRATWYPDAASVAAGLDRGDALDAANLTVSTLRQVFGVDDPGVLDVSGGEEVALAPDGSSSDRNGPDILAPPHSFASDVDGMRHVVVLAQAAEMEGWSVETSSGTSPFESATVWGPEHPNFLGYGEPTWAWVAVCDRSDELLRFVPPATPDASDGGAGVAVGGGARLVYLRSEQGGGNSRYLTARRVASGDLWIEGQDLGDATLPVSPDGEYEWVWVVPAGDLPQLLAVLDGKPGSDVLDVLAGQWTGAASYELERRLRASGLAMFTTI